ncbi:HpcH/HpaI aldolase family protein [Roseivirga sp.]|uniref:HpcH/HpaI aldolase family protein n=1 Tax=Roseivirga sp. TaxID=1964215 RepID=UPI003B8B5A2F
MVNNLFNYNNKIKEKLYQGQVSFGAFLLSANSFIAESLANQRLDWLLIDMEASHASKEDLIHILQALNGYEISPLVRVSDRNKHNVDYSLDFGAKGILFPKIDTINQADEMSLSCFYPPKGTRGVNPIRTSGYYTKPTRYYSSINDALLVSVQIESRESVENVFDIAQSEHVDVLFLGLGDLAASYGQIGNVNGELMEDARKRVLRACKKYDKIPGIFAHSNDVAKQYVKEGFLFIGIGNDIKFMNEGLKDCLKRICE